MAVGQYFPYTSTDGINFTRRTIMQDGAFRDVVYGKGLFIAVGSNSNGPTIYASPDGVTWTLQNAQALSRGSGSATDHQSVSFWRFRQAHTRHLD